jgi:hypothetical protein
MSAGYVQRKTRINQPPTIHVADGSTQISRVLT